VPLKDYYQILGLERQASQAEIKKAFRKLARQYHPDVSKENVGAQQKFNEIAEAYEVLGDPERRKLYDQGHIDQSWFNSQQFHHVRDIFEKTAQRATEAASQSSKKTDSSKNRFRFGDIFNNLVDSVNFTGKEAREADKTQAPNTKKLTQLDLEQTLRISLEEALNGTRKPVDLMQEKTCVLCSGTGEVRQQPCRHCYGKGRVRSEKRLDVKIPAGVRQGSKIRVTGEGLKQGQEQGHLYLLIELAPHPFFRSDEQGHLHCEIPITITEAVLGTEVEVPTLSGRIKLKIPPGTQGGQVFRLRQKGLKGPKGQLQGDQLISAQLVVPKTLSSREKDLYQELFQSGEELRRKLNT